MSVIHSTLSLSSKRADQSQSALATVNTKDRQMNLAFAQATNHSRNGGDGAMGNTWCHGSSDSAWSQALNHSHVANILDCADDLPVASGSREATDSPGSPCATKSPLIAGQAAKLKRKFSVAMGQNPSGTMKVLAEHDPENHEIKRLREKGYKWSEIAHKVNRQRVAVGKFPGLTDNAVYSRYTRNAPRIAAAQGEVWDPKTVGPHPSKKTEPMAPITGFDDLEDQRLVEAYAEIQRETWELVSERMVAKGGKRHDPELCARRYQSI